MGGLARQYAKIPETKRNSPLRIQRTKSSQPIKSPADRILFLQRTIGNQAVQRLIKSGTLQAKLRIGQPGDKYEQEADRVADAVMRMPEPGLQRQVEPEEEEETLQTKPFAGQITPLVQVQRQEEPEEEEETLQAKATSGCISEVNSNLESHILSLKGGGQPLPESARASIKKSVKEKQSKKKLQKKQTRPQSTKGRARMLECQKKCGGSELGNTECEIDLNTGLPSGKVIYEIFDKSLCTGPCINVHEIVHSNDIRGICRNVRNCLDKAGKNIKKEDICLDKYISDSSAIAPITECNAYKASIKCLEERKSADSCVTKKGRIQWKKQMSLEKCYKNCYCKK